MSTISSPTTPAYPPTTPLSFSPDPPATFRPDIEHHLARLENENITLKVTNETLKRSSAELQKGINVSGTIDKLEHKLELCNRYFSLLREIGLEDAFLSDSQVLSNSDDLEEAAVDAILTAASIPGSPWSKIMTEVVGTKTSDNYVSAIESIIEVRRDMKDDKKVAKFWKNTARHDGVNRDIITPSSSTISEVLAQYTLSTETSLSYLKSEVPFPASASKGSSCLTEFSSGTRSVKLSTEGPASYDLAAETNSLTSVRPSSLSSVPLADSLSLSSRTSLSRPTSLPSVGSGSQVSSCIAEASSSASNSSSYSSDSLSAAHLNQRPWEIKPLKTELNTSHSRERFSYRSLLNVYLGIDFNASVSEKSLGKQKPPQSVNSLVPSVSSDLSDSRGLTVSLPGPLELNIFGSEPSSEDLHSEEPFSAAVEIRNTRSVRSLGTIMEESEEEEDITFSMSSSADSDLVSSDVDTTLVDETPQTPVKLKKPFSSEPETPPVKRSMLPVLKSLPRRLSVTLSPTKRRPPLPNSEYLSPPKPQSRPTNLRQKSSPTRSGILKPTISSSMKNTAVSVPPVVKPTPPLRIVKKNAQAPKKVSFVKEKKGLVERGKSRMKRLSLVLS